MKLETEIFARRGLHADKYYQRGLEGIDRRINNFSSNLILEFRGLYRRIDLKRKEILFSLFFFFWFCVFEKFPGKNLFFLKRSVSRYIFSLRDVLLRKLFKRTTLRDYLLMKYWYSIVNSKAFTNDLASYFQKSNNKFSIEFPSSRQTRSFQNKLYYFFFLVSFSFFFFFFFIEKLPTIYIIIYSTRCNKKRCPRFLINDERGKKCAAGTLLKSAIWN